MMSASNENIQGSANISRHLNVGGNAGISGSAVIGHNLIVRGWIDAPNIRGAGKGLFPDIETLERSYPSPLPGWWALVGRGLPAAVYTGVLVQGRLKWVATGEESGEAVLDWEEFDEVKGRVEEMDDMMLMMYTGLSTQYPEERGLHMDRGLNTDNRWWSPGRHFYVDVGGCNVVEIGAGAATAHYVFFKSVAESEMDYTSCLAGGVTQTLGANRRVTVGVPSGARYLCLNSELNGTDRMPAYLRVDERELIGGATGGAGAVLTTEAQELAEEARMQVMRNLGMEGLTRIFKGLPVKFAGNGVREIVLTGLKSGGTYYVRMMSGSYKYLQVFSSESMDSLVAQGTLVGGGLSYLLPKNNSGVSGIVLCDETIGITTTPMYEIDNDAVRNLDNSPGICRFAGDGFKYFVNTLVDGLPALNIRELYVRGRHTTELYLRTTVNGNKRYIQVFSSATELTTSNLVMQGVADRLDVILEEKNGSGFDGRVLLRNIDIIENSPVQQLALAVVSDKANSPRIEFDGQHRRRYHVERDGSGDFPTFYRCLLEATKYEESTIYVGAGVYDVESELKEYHGPAYFESHAGYSSGVGYVLKNRVRVICAPGAEFRFDYKGGNENVNKLFSIFNSGACGFLLRGAKLSGRNCRYCVHDERDSNSDSYENRYENCEMELDNSSNPNWHSHQCIGGGLGCNGLVRITNCSFESKGAPQGYGVVSYHNSAAAGACSRVYVTGCRISGGATVRASWYGESTVMSRMYVSGCLLGASPVCRAETDGSQHQNMELLAWNNVILVS